MSEAGRLASAASPAGHEDGRDERLTPRLLWGSPLPPTRSGISDYAMEMLPHLASLADIRVLRPPDWAEGSEVAGLPMVSVQDRPDGYTPLLHLGNNPYHLWIVRYLRAHGGLAVLHDTVLHHLLVEEAADDDAWERFRAELVGAHGKAGAALAEGRRWGMHGRRDPFMFPARAAYLRLASGVIVHSEQARRDVAKDCPGLPVRHIPLGLAALPTGDRAAWRRRLGAVEGELLLTHLGFLTPAKGVDVIVRATLALRELGVPARLVVVGEGSEAPAFRAAVRQAGLEPLVQLWGFASDADLGGIVGATDLGLVPRFPTAGETSAAALRFLASGVPVAVSGYRQFLELPASAAFRLPPGGAGAAELVRVVAWLSANRPELEQARRAARRAWEDGGYPPEQAARALVTAVEELVRELA